MTTAPTMPDFTQDADAVVIAGAAPCSVERATRSVIEHKLLTALEDDNTVAALLSKRDLEDMIAALYGFEDMGNDGPRKKRCKDLADSMSQLRREAFPPNNEFSGRRPLSKEQPESGTPSAEVTG